MSATYLSKSRRSDFESFANKIFTGIKEINPAYAEKRAIWELFQNALDLVDEEGELSIEKTISGFLFAHNGRPFNDDNLGALVKQYSNGKTYGANGEQVGQYGTGFLSTHVYGKEIILNGCVKGSDGRYRLLKDFKIDRTAPKPDLLVDSLLIQDDKVAKLCDGTDFLIEEIIKTTSFEYIATELGLTSITNMLAYVKTILPYIFCFNHKLSVVKINDGKYETIYKRVSSNNNELVITVNNEPLRVKYLEKTNDNIKVIFPQPNLNFSLLPKQFLYYPLMETVNIGINFIIHAQEFKPNKERDFLHKTEINHDVKQDVVKNKELLTKAYELIIEKIKQDSFLDLHEITNIIFVEEDADFEKELKIKYIDEIKILDRVPVGAHKINIGQISFFDKNLLANEEAFIKHLYDVLSEFCALPDFETYIWLSKLVCNWIDNGISGLNVYDLKTVCKLISQGSRESYDSIVEKESFKFVIKSISTNIELLEEIPLIPNIHHQFCSFGTLKRWEVIEEPLIKVFDHLEASETEKYLHSDFYFISSISGYTREQFKDDFAKYCNRELNAFIKGYIDDLNYPFIKINTITHWLIYFIGLNKTTEINQQLYEFFKRAFEVELIQDEIQSPTVEINYQPAFKLLSRIYVKKIDDLGSVGIEANTGKLLELTTYLNSNINLKDELLDKLPCFPNQSYQLRPQNEVKIDEVVDEDFKDQYFKITGEQIRDKMVLMEFKNYLQHQNSISGVELGDEIETKLSPNKIFLPIQSDHDLNAKEEYSTLLKTLLELIQFISKPESQWGNWLKSIDQVKEEILMHRFKDKDTRLSLFSILSEDEDKINLLGRLAKIPNLEALIEAGEEKQKEDSRKNNHLNYINYIGILIQDLVEDQLGKELAEVISIMKSEKDANLTTQEEQNGQDFIIYKNNNPIYYLEVKSKWDENGRFALSKNQTEKCAAKKENYAVILVNVDRYKRKNSISNENIAFNDLKEFIKVNDDLGDYFDKLVLENNTKVELTDPKLIEFRGSIPQSLIDISGNDFDHFIQKLIDKIKEA